MTDIIRIEYKDNKDIYSNNIKSVFYLFYNDILKRFDDTIDEKDNFSETEVKIEKLNNIDDNIEPIVNIGGEYLEITIDSESTVLVLKNDKYSENEKDDIVNNSIRVLKEYFEIENVGVQFRDNITNDTNEFIKKYICPVLLKGKEEKLISSKVIYNFKEDSGIASVVFIVDKNVESVSFVNQIVETFKKDYIFNYKQCHSKYLELKDEIYSRMRNSI